MRRSFLQLIAACAYGGMVASAALLGCPAAASPAAVTFDVLSRAALPMQHPSSAAMLAVARAGKRLVAVGERGIVLLSDDEASTWRQAQVPVSVTLTAVQFVDQHQGWAIGHLGVVLHTEDGGAHWTRQFDGIRAAAIAMQAAREGGAAEGGDLARNIGVAQTLVDDGPDKPFLDLYFENDRTGYVVGAYNLVFRTDDGGRTWRSWMGHLANPKGLHLYAIKAVGDALYIAGEQGLLLRSTDHGEHFAAINSPSKGTYFGLVTGRDGELLLYGLRGRAFWSTDGAASWTEVNTGTLASLSAGTALADGTMVLVSQSGEMMASRDGGRSFKQMPHGAALPVTGLAESVAGQLVVSSLRGLRRLDTRPAAR